MANKAYKFRLYPTGEQEQLLAKTFGCVRFVYNKMLTEQQETYEKYKDDKETLKKQKFPTPAKYKEEFAWLKEVDSLALANAQINLQKAYKNFFSGRAEFPKFKNRKARQSYTTNVVNGNIMLLDGYIKLPKLKLVKMKQHREIPSHHIIKSCTVSRTKTRKYYVSILTEYEHPPVQKEVQAVVGLDFSMSGLFVDSEKGKKANYPRFYRQALEKLAKEQRILPRRKKGSTRWHKQRLKVAKLHERIANQRKDFLHKESHKLAKRYDCVVIEDLNMKGMSQALHFGKSVADNAWGMFTTFLGYKLEEQGKQLIKIDKWFPSSKTCSCCGQVKESLSLSERTFRCDCGFVADRDWNASINIKNEGLRLLALI
ncbi:RNA-guided endonuclease TnpB family protein [Aneurinibacillus aneurinilyticus]|uniref:IS200/IS605 family element transposase accessory protein TnpB n=2 Tax=Aneurinibacillus aneurinilyticus TaxID=1391 RepID=A0A848D1Y7_ANEAE|nr:RNA-guided endonuclease TnpB family protein [Aneurinibacillus aneurinilyticus]NMF00760.1 IS200/IS605 family element transposase accessory protein TnpB [Aneurinibacillus aneurinilyticus]